MSVDTTHTETDTAEVVDPVDEPDPTEDTPEVVDADDTEDDDGDTGDSRGREAAKWRRKLRDAQAEHTTTVANLEAAHAATTETLSRQRQAIVDATLAGAGLDPRLASAAGITADAVLTDDGLIDGQKLRTAVAAAVAEFGVSPRGKGPVPNRQQGNPSTGDGGGATWSSVLGGRR